MFGGIPLEEYLQGKKICDIAAEFGVSSAGISQAMKLGTTFVFNLNGINQAYIIKKLGSTKSKKQK